MRVMHMGYKAVQMSDFRIWITKDRHIVATILCRKPVNEGKLIKAIEAYIELTEVEK